MSVYCVLEKDLPCDKTYFSCQLEVVRTCVRTGPISWREHIFCCTCWTPRTEDGSRWLKMNFTAFSASTRDFQLWYWQINRWPCHPTHLYIYTFLNMAAMILNGFGFLEFSVGNGSEGEVLGSKVLHKSWVLTRHYKHLCAPTAQAKTITVFLVVSGQAGRC